MKYLYEGTITNQALRKQQPFYMRRLDMEDLPAIEQAQQMVIDSLPEKAVLQPLSTEEFLFILQGHGLLIGAFVEEQLIGFRALLIPVIDEEHLGLDIGLSENELSQVIYQEISIVVPDYRGNRLQQKLANIIMKELPNLKQSFRYVCCTVAPMNIPSLKDKFLQEMHINALTEKYKGMQRYILVKDLERPNQQYADYIAAKLDDLDRQRQLLEEGYVGIGFKLVKGFHEIQFAKPV